MCKRIIYVAMLVGSVLFAQEVDKKGDEPIKVEIVKNTSFEEVEYSWENELSINIYSLIAHPAIDISYEKIFDSSNSVGVNLFWNIGDASNIVSHRKFSIGPYYRMYFLNRKDYGAKGFFVEISSSYTSLGIYDYDFYYYDDVYAEDDTIDAFSIGASVGKKWVNRKGFSAEVSIGVVRHLNEEAYDYSGGLGKLSLSIGKRF